MIKYLLFKSSRIKVMTVSELKTYLPSTYPIIEKQLKRAHLICIVACSVIKYTGKVFYDYSSQKTQLIPGVLIGIRAGFYFSATLSLPLTIIAGAISLIAYSLLISTARTLRNFQFHKEGWKKEFDPYQDPFIKILQSEEKLKAQAEALKKSLTENQEKYERQLELAQTLPEDASGVLDVSNYEDYRTLIHEFNQFITKAYNSLRQGEKIDTTELALIAKYKLIFWILSKIRFDLRSSLSHHLQSYETYKKLGGILPEMLYPKQHLDQYQTDFLLSEIQRLKLEKKEEEEQPSFVFFKKLFIEGVNDLETAHRKTQNERWRAALELTMNRSCQNIFSSLLPRFFNAQSELDIDRAPVDNSINYTELVRDYYHSLSDSKESFYFTNLGEQKEHLKNLLFGENSGLNKLLKRFPDAGSPLKGQKEELEVYYQLQEKQLLIILTYIEKRKQEILKKFNIQKIPSVASDPACKDNPELTSAARDIIQIQSSFTEELARQSEVCSTGIKSCIQERFDVLGPLIFGTTVETFCIENYLAKLVGDFRKSKVSSMISGLNLNDVHDAGNIKSVLSLFFRFPFETNFIEGYLPPGFPQYFGVTSYFIQKYYNPLTITTFVTENITKDYREKEDFKNLLYLYLDHLALKQLDGEQDWKDALDLLIREYETLDRDFQRKKLELEQQKSAFYKQLEEEIPLAKEHQLLEKIDFNYVLNSSTEDLKRYLNGCKTTIWQRILAGLDQKDPEKFKSDLAKFIERVTEFANGILQSKTLSPFKYREAFITRVSENFLVHQHDLFTGVNFLKEPGENLKVFKENLQNTYKSVYRAVWIDEETGAIIEGKKIELTQKLLVDYGYCTEDAFR